ncbi:MAG TPA: multiheme c-type cytochrome, partial [Flavisolibacter sp.]|nr:multiheme c-type cytochrome [Flavisolibacter sp.]
ATQIDFGRFIGGNCFECHSSFAKSRLNASTAGIEEALDRSSILYGIDCERCHGPAIDHVNYHEAHPEDKKAKYLVDIAHLERDRKLDVCAVCHSGNKKLQQISTFQFRPGDTLSNFFVLWQDQNSKAGFDVHGNQFQMLSQSPCFLQSKTLECSSCHDPHTNAIADVSVYSAKCMSCHSSMTHPQVDQQSGLGQLQQNCIDCHMPNQPSRAISFETDDRKGKTSYFLRTHKIGIYKER